MPSDSRSITPEALLAHSAWARRLARSLLGDPDAAEDVWQETWLAALEGNPPPGRLRAWLAGVVRKRAGTRRRAEARRAVRERAVARGEARTDAQALERAELRQVLMECVLALDDPYRSTILLHFFEELPLAEIARRRGQPAATVRSHLHRGLARLREELSGRSEGGANWTLGLAALALPKGPAGRGGGALVGGATPLAGAAFALGIGAAAKLGLLASLAALLALVAWLARGSAPAPEPGPTSVADATPRGGGDEHARAGPDDGDSAQERTAVGPAVVPIPSPGGAVVSGRVVDVAGRPVGGARVLLASTKLAPTRGRLDTLYYADERAPHGATTDAQGRFVISGLQPGVLRVAVRAGGFAPFDDDSRYLGAGPALDLGELTLSAGLVIEGRVVDAAGASVAGALVLRDEEETGMAGFGYIGDGDAGSPVRALLAETDADGSFRAESIAPGPWRLRVEHPDHAARLFEGAHFDPGLSSGHLFPLFASTSVSGRLVAPWAGEGFDCTGLKVSLSYAKEQPELAEAMREHRYQSLELGADGRFTFRGVRTRDDGEPTRYVLGATRIYGRLVRKVAEPLVVAAGDEDVLVEMHAWGSLGFALQDALTRSPIDDLQGYLVLAGNNHIDLAASGTLERLGAGRFRAVEIGVSSDVPEIGLHVKAAGYQSRVLHGLPLRAGELTEVGTLDLAPAPTLEARVLDAATREPIVGAKVVALAEDVPSLMQWALGKPDVLYPRRNDEAVTDAEGVARLTLAEGYESLVQVTHADYAPAAPHRLLPARVGVHEQEWTLDRGGSLVALVLDETGAPVPAVAVWVADTLTDRFGSPRFQAEASSDAAGRARFERLPTCELRVSVRGGVEDQEAAPLVQVRPGLTATVELVVPSRVAVGGRLTERGRALSGALVQALRVAAVEPPGSPAQLRAAVRTATDSTVAWSDGEGRFAFDGLAVGDHVLYVDHASRALPEFVAVVVERDLGPLAIDLGTNAVQGRVIGPDGRALAGCDVHLLPGAELDSMLDALDRRHDWSLDQARTEDVTWAASDAAGTFRFQGLPAGLPLVAAVLEPGFQRALSEPFTLEPDELREALELRLLPGGRIVVSFLVPESKRNMARFLLVEASREGVRRVGSRDELGRATIEGLEPGAWRLAAYYSAFGTKAIDGLDPTTVEVRADATTEVTIEIP